MQTYFEKQHLDYINSRVAALSQLNRKIPSVLGIIDLSKNWQAKCPKTVYGQTIVYLNGVQGSEEIAFMLFSLLSEMPDSNWRLTHDTENAHYITQYIPNSPSDGHPLYRVAFHIISKTLIEEKSLQVFDLNFIPVSSALVVSQNPHEPFPIARESFLKVTDILPYNQPKYISLQEADRIGNNIVMDIKNKNKNGDSIVFKSMKNRLITPKKVWSMQIDNIV
jgi:hypothetical protein